MDTTLEKVELDEEKLLCYSSENEAKEIGCIGHLRGDFGKDGDGFYCNWFEHLNDDKNDGNFQGVFDMLIDNLRAPGNVLGGLSDMKKYCRGRIDCKNDKSYTDKCWEYRILTNEYAFYLRCTPVQGDYHFYCYCYDREMLMKKLAAVRGLPLYSYSYIHATGEEIRIDFAMRDYCVVRNMASGKSAREMNREIGVTPEQAEAMKNACMYGWNSPEVNPQKYEKNKKNRGEER